MEKPVAEKGKQKCDPLGFHLILFKLMLSEEKAKQQVQAIIKEIGLKDEVKKHLRLKLAERLQKTQQLPQLKITSDILRHRIISSIIQQHLEKIGCTYSASVFAAESECEEKMLERVQLIELLNIPSAYEALSLLEYFIEKSPGRSAFTKATAIQTQQQEGVLSLEQKFTLMDLEFRRALQQKQANLPVRKAHDCLQEKKWYQKELFKFKEFEAHKIKIKVGQEWRIKFQAYASSLQNDFKVKVEKLRSKQKSLTEQLIGKQKAFEENKRNWQASAKSRLDLIEMKETSLSRQKTNIQGERRKIADEGKKVVDDAKDRARQYDTLLLNLQKRIDYEVGIVKLSLQQAQNEKEQEFTNRRRFVDEEYGKLMGIKDTLELLKVQNQRLAQQNSLLRQQCKKLREEVRLALGQASGKADRIDSIRDELTDVKNFNKDLEMRIKQQTKTREKREAQLIEARKQLESIRLKLADQILQSEDELEKRPKTYTMQRKIVQLRQQRKKDIEKFKLQI